MKKAWQIDIEELFLLLKKVRDYILHNIKEIENITKTKEFFDVFIIQCLILWFLQQKRVFNDDNSYLITKLRELSNGGLSQHFNSYFEFIISLLYKITDPSDSYIYKDEIFGELKVFGPTLLLIDKKDLELFHIPNHCLYNDDCRDYSINHSSKKQNDVSPIFNILERLSSNRGNIDEFVIGAIYEKLINLTEKKRSGAYYTPEPLSYYTSKTALNYYIIEETNAKFDLDFELFDEILESCDKDVFIFLFELIKDITILDPAVGTGHFLESATKILLEIYNSIWKNLPKFQLNYKFVIEAILTSGKTAYMDLNDISDETEFNFFVLFHVLSNNIYGIDINENVIKIAKARLFLFLMRFFNVYIAQNISPMNISLNLKCGNSLIGFIDFPSGPTTKQLHLDTYFPEIKKSSSEILIEDLEMFSRQDCHLIEREHIYDNLHSRFDIIYSRNYNIELSRLKGLKPLHWCLEFPHIFTKENGFNIIIANPPYLGESGNKNLFRVLSLCLEAYYEGKVDLWYLFLHRSLDLLKSDAYLSFITSNYWITASGAEKLRSRILSQASLLRYVNFGENKAFSNAQGVHTNIFTLKKASTPNTTIKVTLFMNDYPINTNLINKLDKQLNFKMNQTKLIFKDWDSYFHFLPEEYRVIFDYITKYSTMLKNDGFYTKEGIVTGLNNITVRQIRKYNLPEELKGVGVFILNEKDERDLSLINTFNDDELALLKPFYKNSDIQRFRTAIKSHKKIIYLNRNTVNLETLPNIKIHLKKFSRVLENSLDNPPFINRPRNPGIFTKYKIITPQRSIRNSFAYNSYDWYAAQDVYYILSERNSIERLKSLLLILNSRLAYFWFFWMGKRKGKQLELFGEPLNFFPIPENFTKLVSLADYLLFLYSVKDLTRKFLKIRNFFENYIVDSLIFELYFENEFTSAKDLHCNNHSLIQLVLKFVRKVNFEEWNELTYRNELSKPLNEEDSIRIKNLKGEIFQRISDSYVLLKQNEEIMRIIKQIHSHKWIQSITNFLVLTQD
jgi:hypothetical protein